MHPYREPTLPDAEAKRLRGARAHLAAAWRRCARVVATTCGHPSVAKLVSHAVGVAAGILMASVLWFQVVQHLTTQVVQPAPPGAKAAARAYAQARSAAARDVRARDAAARDAAARAAAAINAQMSNPFHAADIVPPSFFATYGVPPAAADTAIFSLRHAAESGADITIEDTELSTYARDRLQTSAQNLEEGDHLEHLDQWHLPYRLVDVPPGAVLDLLGFRANDVLLSIDGDECKAPESDWTSELRRATGRWRSGGALTIEYLRGGARHAVEIHW